VTNFEKNLAGKRVFITGHSGFTGTWACLWFRAIETEIYGYSLPPDTEPSFYNEIGLEKEVSSKYADICNYENLYSAVSDFQPDIILHLAAQPLVRRSYKEPINTHATNIMGTANILEAARSVPSVKAIVCVTTDKVYKNNEWPWPYRENDPLGGKDPYSASKAAAEMVIDSYRYSYSDNDAGSLAIAAARGGNIIGGGDWSADRLVPDFVRAINSGKKLTLRYPDATRPWQHVLALVQGYMMLLSGLLENPKKYARAWNLGPHDAKHLSVREVLETLSNVWKRPELEYMDNPLPEASALALDSTLARNLLEWQPAWDAQQVISETASWYKEYYSDPLSIRQYSIKQLDDWRREINNK